jgi:hypothetical protein
MCWLISFILLGVCEAAGGGVVQPQPDLQTNTACTSVDGFSKCCGQFSHPGLCYKIDSSDAHPEDTCASFCLLKGGKYSDSDHRALGSDLEAYECAGPDDHSHRRLGSSSSSSASKCKAESSSNASESHRILGGTTASSFCPLERTYYLHEAVDEKCFNQSYITTGHLDKHAKHDGTHCAFFDYNPDTHLCCIPAKDEPAVPSFNRYTFDYDTAKAKWDHRRLGGDGPARRDWTASLEYIKEEKDTHNKCPAPVQGSPHPHIFGIGATLNLFEFSICLCILILATLFLEILTDLAHDYVHSLHNHNYRAIFEKITSELMILGCISFIIFICEVELGLASASYYLELELAHLVLFFIGLIFVMQSIYLLVAMTTVVGFWRTIDPHSNEKLSELCEQAMTGKPTKMSLWRKYVLAESLRFHIVKQV